MLAMKALRGASWLVLSRFLGRFVDFFTLLILARVLAPADFGMTALAMALIFVVDIVLEVPVSQALMRLKTIETRHLDTGFTLGALRGALVAVIVLGAAWPFSLIYDDSRFVPLLAVLAIGPITRGLYSPSMIHFVRDMSFHRVFMTEIVGKLSAFVVAIVVVLLGGGYWAIAANYVTASVVATVVSYLLAPYRPKLTLSRLSDFASFIGWFTSAQVVSAINWQFDKVILGTSVDKATLGRYAVASDLAVLPTQSLIGPALQPVMAAFSKINTEPERLQLAFLKAARVAMLVSAPVSIGIALTADLIVALLLGPKWHDAAPFLRVLALAVVTIPYFQALYSFSLAIDRPFAVFKLNCIDLVLRVVLVALGLYAFSIEGVLAARLAVAVCMFGFYLREARNLAGVKVSTQLLNLWKVAAASITMALSVLLLRHAIAPLELAFLVELPIVAATGAAVFAITLLLCGLRLVIGPGRLDLYDKWW